jgi:hypothetical protein
MEKREMRIVKFIGPTPFLAVCTQCNQQFRIAGTGVHTVESTTNILKSQFDAHKCQSVDSKNAPPIARDAKEDK